MAPSLVTSVEGDLVGFNATSYEITDDKTKEKKVVVANRAWLVLAFDAAPLEVEIRGAEKDILSSLGLYKEAGVPVRVLATVEPFAKSKKTGAEQAYRLVALEEVAAKDLPARGPKAA